MSFDFFEQPDPPHSSNNDLVDIMKKIEDQDNFNFDFDHFDDPPPSDPLDRSEDSDFFRQKSEKKESEKMQSAKSRNPSRELELDNSRDLAEISMVDNSGGSSFRYEAPPARTPPLDSAN